MLFDSFLPYFSVLTLLIWIQQDHVFFVTQQISKFTFLNTFLSLREYITSIESLLTKQKLILCFGIRQHLLVMCIILNYPF